MLIVYSYNIIIKSYLVAVRVVYVYAVSLILFWRMLRHVVYPFCVYDDKEGVFMSCIIRSNMYYVTVFLYRDNTTLKMILWNRNM
jgi:hypothetical protein